MLFEFSTHPLSAFLVTYHKVHKIKLVRISWVKLGLYMLLRLQNLYQSLSGTYHRCLIMGQCASVHPSYPELKSELCGQVPRTVHKLND